jgi:membrane protease subunit (stomatin/prohibitin family)
MGSIKALTGTIGGVLADQWKEHFCCGSLNESALAVKGQKRASRRSSNTKGEDNVDSNGSVVVVNDGQWMIVGQGKVVELSAEPGEYACDQS